MLPRKKASHKLRPSPPHNALSQAPSQHLLYYERQIAALHAASLAVPATEATRVAAPSPAAASPEEERPALPVPAARTDAAGERTATARKEGEKKRTSPPASGSGAERLS